MLWSSNWEYHFAILPIHHDNVLFIVSLQISKNLSPEKHGQYYINNTHCVNWSYASCEDKFMDEFRSQIATT